MDRELSNDEMNKVNLLKGLAKHFEIDLTIRLFGISIIRFHWPPEVTNSKIFKS